MFDKSCYTDNIVDKVKLLPYWWLKVNYINLALGYHGW